MTDSHLRHRSAAAGYRRIRNESLTQQSTPQELILLVYESLVDRLVKCQGSLAQGADADFSRENLKCMQLIQYGLRDSLSFDLGGEVAKLVSKARASEASQRARLEREAERIDGLAASFRGSSKAVVQQRWLDAVRDVMDNPQAEVFAAPNLLGLFNLRITSSAELMQARRDAQIQRQKAEEAVRNAGGFYAPNSEQIMINKAGRRLKRDASGGLGR